MAFSKVELEILLRTPRIGPVVVQRLEQAGLDSLAAMLDIGIEATIERICRQVGSNGWANRRRPLARALDAAAAWADPARPGCADPLRGRTT